MKLKSRLRLAVGLHWSMIGSVTAIYSLLSDKGGFIVFASFTIISIGTLLIAYSFREE